MTTSILHVLNSPALGGTESWVLNFAAASAGRVDNGFLLFDEDGPLRDEMAPFVRGIAGRRGSRPRRLLDVLRACRDVDADQIWLHSDLARTYGAFVPRRRTCVAVCHSPWGASTVLQRLGGPARRSRWDGIVTVSERLFDEVPPDCPRERLAALVPPPRASGAASDAAFEAAGGPSSGGPTLVYVARLVAGKGHETLLRSLPAVASRHPGVSLVLVGEGPLRADLAELVAREGLEPLVTFAGGATDVASHLAAADVFVHPSESEGFSVSGLEAALAGVPIVARALPCHDDYLHVGRNGLTFDETDGALAAALAAALVAVLDDLPSFAAGAADVRDALAGSLRDRFDAGLDEVLAWR